MVVRVIVIALKRSFGQSNIFSSVCQENCSHGVGVCLSACWGTTPQEQTPPLAADPPGPGTPPKSRHPLGPGTPPGADPRSTRHPPPCSACWKIRSTSGRYASYWNAIFLLFCYLSLIWATYFFCHRAVFDHQFTNLMSWLSRIGTSMRASGSDGQIWGVHWGN